MIKYIEWLIKIVIVSAVIFFFYHFIKDANSFLKNVNTNESYLDKFIQDVNILSIEVQKSKDFYERNQVVIDATRINDSELQKIKDALFGEIIDKKLGFFSLVEQYSYRDQKVINVYTINAKIKLDVESLFSMEEAKVLINNQLNKKINIINDANKNKVELIPNKILVENNLYSIELLILKKHDETLTKGDKI